MKVSRALPTAAGVFTLGALGSACFTAQLDPEAPNSFSCCSDEDCPGEQQCVDTVCSLDRDGVDPSIGPIRCPEEGSRLLDNICPAGEPDLFRLDFEVERGDGRDVEIVGTLDGNPLEIDQASGDVAPLARPLEPGVHRIHIELLDPSSGERFPNPGAVRDGYFWIDDGREHVAIVSPTPGTDIRPGQELAVSVAAINFDYRHVSCDHNEYRQGHLHLFEGVDVDACFPATCVGDWFGTLMPAPSCGPQTVPEFTARPGSKAVDGTFTVFPDDVSTGPTMLSIVGETQNHLGYVREDDSMGGDEQCDGPAGTCITDSVLINVVVDECAGEI